MHHRKGGRLVFRLEGECLVKLFPGGTGIAVVLPGDAHLDVKVGLWCRQFREVPQEIRRFVPAFLLFKQLDGFF